MKQATLWLTVLLLGTSPAFGREPKEYDSDVVYDESKIPSYDLPPLLVTAEGEPVTTPEQWRNCSHRRAGPPGRPRIGFV